MVTLRFFVLFPTITILALATNPEQIEKTSVATSRASDIGNDPSEAVQSTTKEGKQQSKPGCICPPVTTDETEAMPNVSSGSARSRAPAVKHKQVVTEYGHRTQRIYMEKDAKKPPKTYESAEKITLAATEKLPGQREEPHRKIGVWKRLAQEQQGLSGTTKTSESKKSAGTSGATKTTESKKSAGTSGATKTAGTSGAAKTTGTSGATKTVEKNPVQRSKIYPSVQTEYGHRTQRLQPTNKAVSQVKPASEQGLKKGQEASDVGKSTLSEQSIIEEIDPETEIS